MRKNIFKILLFTFPVFFVSTLCASKIYSPVFYGSLVEEDGIFEFMQVLLYLLAAAFFLFTSKRLLEEKQRDLSLIFLVFSLGLVLVCAEELSWGQRILALDSPEFFTRNNVQRELTIHNLSLFQPFLHLGYILTGLAGATGWLLVRTAGKPQWDSAVPAWYISTYFLPVFFIYLYFELSYHLGRLMSAEGFSVSRQWISWRDQELAELLLAAGFFLYSFIAFKMTSVSSPPGNRIETSGSG